MMRRAGGFTLIEVLLATGLLAVGLALGFATLRAAGATAQRGEAMAERNERIRAVSDFMRRRIAGAQGIVFELDPGTGASKRFEGDANTMRFVADLPDYLGRGGPHLHAVRFAYRGLAGNGEFGPWEAAWEDPAKLPLQVRVQVVDARGAWPDMVVALPVAGSFATLGDVQQ